MKKLNITTPKINIQAKGEHPNTNSFHACTLITAGPYTGFRFGELRLAQVATHGGPWGGAPGRR